MSTSFLARPPSTAAEDRRLQHGAATQGAGSLTILGGWHSLTAWPRRRPSASRVAGSATEAAVGATQPITRHPSLRSRRRAGGVRVAAADPLLGPRARPERNLSGARRSPGSAAAPATSPAWPRSLRRD